MRVVRGRHSGEGVVDDRAHPDRLPLGVPQHVGMGHRGRLPVELGDPGRVVTERSAATLTLTTARRRSAGPDRGSPTGPLPRRVRRSGRPRATGCEPVRLARGQPRRDCRAPPGLPRPPRPRPVGVGATCVRRTGRRVDGVGLGAGRCRLSGASDEQGAGAASGGTYQPARSRPAAVAPAVFTSSARDRR